MFYKVCIIITLLTYNPIPETVTEYRTQHQNMYLHTKRAGILFSRTMWGWMNGKSMENGLENIWRAETFVSFTLYLCRIYLCLYIDVRLGTGKMMYYRTRQWWYVLEINLLCCGLGCFVGKKDCSNANVMVILQSQNILFVDIYKVYLLIVFSYSHHVWNDSLVNWEKCVRKESAINLLKIWIRLTFLLSIMCSIFFLCVFAKHCLRNVVWLCQPREQLADVEDGR